MGMYFSRRWGQIKVWPPNVTVNSPLFVIFWRAVGVNDWENGLKSVLDFCHFPCFVFCFWRWCLSDLQLFEIQITKTHISCSWPGKICVAIRDTSMVAIFLRERQFHCVSMILKCGRRKTDCPKKESIVSDKLIERKTCLLVQLQLQRPEWPGYGRGPIWNDSKLECKEQWILIENWLSRLRNCVDRIPKWGAENGCCAWDWNVEKTVTANNERDSPGKTLCRSSLWNAKYTNDFGFQCQRLQWCGQNVSGLQSVCCWKRMECEAP